MFIQIGSTHKMKNDGERRDIYENPTILRILVFGVLLIVYGFPQGLLTRYYGIDFSVDKLLFSILVIGLFVINKIKTMKITSAQVLFIVLSIVFACFSHEPRCLLLCYLPAVEDLLPYRSKICDILKKSRILYVCLGMTVFYTFIYSRLGIVNSDRYAFSAIGEINQSGLAIFCLSVMMMVKNKRVGYLCMGFGLLTVSRSYFLAVALYFIGKVKMIKKILIRVSHWRVFNYWAIVALSSIALIGLGFFFIWQNKIGNVYWGDDVETRIFRLLDYSNLFRFVTNVSLIMIFIRYPYALLTGLSDQAFFSESAVSYNMLGIPFRATNPHNLFFSHLRIYGAFSFVETWYIARIFWKIVNNRTLIVFIISALYSIFLGAGLYSYWLFITIFSMSAEERNSGVLALNGRMGNVSGN